jgi:hypothetical protein
LVLTIKDGASCKFHGPEAKVLEREERENVVNCGKLLNFWSFSRIIFPGPSRQASHGQKLWKRGKFIVKFLAGGHGIMGKMMINWGWVKTLVPLVTSK